LADKRKLLVTLAERFAEEFRSFAASRTLRFWAGF
jgi:hypothetical protein